MMRNDFLERLDKALKTSFSIEDLRRLVKFKLGENLDEFARTSTRDDAVFDLLNWAERTGRTADLVAAARAARPGRPDWPALAEELGLPPDHIDPESLLQDLEQKIARQQALLFMYEESLAQRDNRKPGKSPPKR